MSPRQSPKAYARALQAIAHERCVTDLTDGFCGPRDGKCRHMAPQRRCVVQAAAILQSLETAGMLVVWDYDPELWGAR